MAFMDIVFGLLKILTLNVRLVSYELEEETHEHMEQRVEMMVREVIQMWQEVEERSQEQRNQEQSSFAWASPLLSALQHWQYWAIALVLVLVFGLCWWLRKRSREPEREDESSDSNVEEEEHEEENDNANEDEEENDDANEAQEENDEANEAQEENDEANEAQEQNDEANEAQEQNDEPNEAEEENHEANEAQDENDDANEAQEENDEANEAQEQNDEANEAQEQNDEPNEAQDENDEANEAQVENDEANEAEEEDDDANDPGRFFEEQMQRPAENRDRDCRAVMTLMEIFIALYQNFFSNTYLPVLEKAIEVGSAFESWSPREEDITYRMLVPLKPPHGHIFYLEPGPECLARNFRIRVESVCTCAMERLTGQTPCFLHDPEQEQRRNGDPNILQDLCTDSYLDVQKTARFFQMFVRRAWRALPVSTIRHLTMLPSDRSCKFQLSQRRGKRILIELLFGVQEADSDIFVSSQYTEAAYTPSTIWPESYAVAEMKFFRLIASQAQPDSCHLRCLQLCVRSLLGRDFSTYTLKTVVMHLLTTIPLSQWRRRHFWARLGDIMQYLQSCLASRRLNHFFVGNENVPVGIILPLHLRMAEPLNLFQHLTQNPKACVRAQVEFEELQRRLHRMVLYGH